MSKERMEEQGQIDRGVRPLYGEDKLRSWLTAHGFRCAENTVGNRENECNWYAYRRSEFNARRCECNYDKPGIQIVVKPSAMKLGENKLRNAEVELCGEAGGVWWKLSAYNMKPGEIPDKLGAVEAALVAAWNALHV